MNKNFFDLIKQPKLWILPVIAVSILMACLSGSYLSGVANSTQNLSNLPIAIVNKDKGAELPSDSYINVGNNIQDGLFTKMDSHKFSLQVLSEQQAKDEMNKGELYGYLELPSDLSSSVVKWATNSLSTGAVKDLTAGADHNSKENSTTGTNGTAGTEQTTGDSSTSASTEAVPALTQPSVTVYYNTRDGMAAGNVARTALTQAADTSSQQVGEQLNHMMGLIKPDASTVSATGLAALKDPLAINAKEFDPLPPGTGNGITAFYWALIVVLAGFTGSVVVNLLIDGQLGITPSEFGSLFILRRLTRSTRLTQLLLKWFVMALVALAVSTIYIGIAHWIGMPLDHPWKLWGFTLGGIFAVSLLAQASNAAFGSLGMIFNLLYFVILSIPASGGTLPLELEPQFFRWAATVTPMHHIYEGARSLLYFNANPDAGLTNAIWFLVILAIVGIALGIITTTSYDGQGRTRGRDTIEEVG